MADLSPMRPVPAASSWSARRPRGALGPRIRLVVAAVLGSVWVAWSGPGAVAQVAGESDPPWSVEEARLAAGLECPSTFAHPEREPVLLVHGTFTAGREQYGWNYGLLLPERGVDVCLVTYPDRGLGDLQESAEYVAHAILAIHDLTDRRVDVMGHSQGGLLPRWAVRFWPSVRAAVDDVVLVAPPSHGTSVADGAGSFPTAMPAAFFQMGPSSQLIAALNSSDETPGDDVSWSVLYTDHDELVQPVAPVPTAALDWGHEAANTRNVRIQDVCPGRIVDHLTIGTTDRLSQELVLDAFSHPGPVDPARLGPPSVLCTLPDQYLAPAQAAALLDQLPRSMAGGFPDFHAVDEEPALKPYAAAALASPPRDQAASGAGASPVAQPVVESAGASRGGRLPATGASIPLAAGPPFVLAAIGLRRLVCRPLT